MLLPIDILVDVIIHPLAVWDVQLLKVNGRFNSAVGLIAACREAEVHIVFLVLLKKIIRRVLLFIFGIPSQWKVESEA